jgi:hypothetical protein
MADSIVDLMIRERLKVVERFSTRQEVGNRHHEPLTQVMSKGYSDVEAECKITQTFIPYQGVLLDGYS